MSRLRAARGHACDTAAHERDRVSCAVTLALVLSGGGANGAFEAGVVAAVEHAGLRPTIYSGTSAGALNAAGLAAGLDAARLAAVWSSVTARDVFRLRGDIGSLIRLDGLFGRAANLGERVLGALGWTWLLDTTPLRRTLIRALGGSRVAVRDGVVCVVSAVEQASGGLVRFTSSAPPPRRADLRYRVVDLDVDHLLASAAIPLLFRPGDVAGEAFWDGGLVAHTPLAPALAYEPEQVIVVTTATRERPAPPPRTLGEAVGLLVDNLLRFSLDNDLARARQVNALARAAPEATTRRVVDFLVVEPTGLDLGSSLDFSPALARRRLALGEEVGRAAIAEWRAAGRL